MDKTIFNNIAINISHAITREDRNMDEFKHIAKLIELLFDKIKEEIPMACIDLKTFDNEKEYHEPYTCRPIIRQNKREIIIGCFSCIRYMNKPIYLKEINFCIIDMDPNSTFPQIGKIEFDDMDENTNNRIIDLAVNIFKTFLNSGEIDYTYISKDMLE